MIASVEGTDDRHGDASDGIDELEAEIAEALTRTKRTAASAESLTGGSVSAGLSAIEGASDWFLGGVVAYAAEVKYDLLGVDRGPVINAQTAGRWRPASLACCTRTSPWRRPASAVPVPRRVARRAPCSSPWPHRRLHDARVRVRRRPATDHRVGDAAGAARSGGRSHRPGGTERSGQHGLKRPDLAGTELFPAPPTTGSLRLGRARAPEPSPREARPPETQVGHRAGEVRLVRGHVEVAVAAQRGEDHLRLAGLLARQASRIAAARAWVGSGAGHDALGAGELRARRRSTRAAGWRPPRRGPARRCATPAAPCRGSAARRRGSARG